MYALLISLLTLLFSIITILIPDTIDRYWELRTAGSNARGAIAFLLVVTPTFIILNRAIFKQQKEVHTETYVPITRWIVYLSLFVGSAVLLGTLISVIMHFLNGELTIRFILKVLVTLTIIGAAIAYYVHDTKGYWHQHTTARKYVELGLLGVVTLIVLVSFTLIDSPTTIREISIDQQQIQDLREVEWRIEESIRANEVIPESIAELYPDGQAPEAPTGRAPYTFNFDEAGYGLCATFAHDDLDRAGDTMSPIFRPSQFATVPYHIEHFDDWTYQAGEHCFTRTVTFEDTDSE